MKLFILISLFAVQTVTMAFRAHAQDTSGDFCQQWFEEKKLGALDDFKLPSSKWSLLIQALKVRFFPNSFSNPDFQVVMPQNRVKMWDNVNQVKGRNVIFFVGAPPEILASETKKEAKNKIKAMEKEVGPLLKNVLKLIKTSDVDSCMALEKNLNFNYADYGNILDQSGSLRDDKQISNEDAALKDLKKAIKKTYFDWEVQNFTDLNEVYIALHDPRLENLVIVSHGQSNSMILDSRWNEYPKYFFNFIPPRLRSINFYSCYSQQVPLQYGLQALLEKSPSYFGSRLITTVQKNPRMVDVAMAPLNGFSHYLHSLEYQLEDLQQNDSKAASVPAYVPPSDCSIQVQSPQIKSGTYGFFLNQKYVGSLAAGLERAAIFHFPCNFIDLNKNILTNRNINTTVKLAAISGKTFEVLQWNDPGGSKIFQTDHYKTPDGQYQSSKWTISR